MKRAALFVMLGCVLLVPGSGTGSPLKGKHSLGRQRIPERGRVRFEGEFRAGERACVIVKGDHDPVVDLGLYVYDEKGELVTKDENGGDFVAVIWYPPRDAKYRVEIANPGQTFNDCYISLK